mmetsp:Transcript_45798/g.74714  ORF Transcript_45798/g.74714 Transcript_45798/m.74714 type:complete len:170 (+) Transcript_45798:53-562(+)
MRHSRILAVGVLVLFACVSIVAAAEEKKLKTVSSLQIGVKHKPAECTRVTKKGDTLKIHYTGTLTDGTKFDSSVDRGDPFSFKVGAGQVIKGWDQGLIGMCIGEKRRLKIPAHLGYGDRGSPPKIPGGATLVFDTELIDIEDSKGPSAADYEAEEGTPDYGEEIDYPPA